MKKIFDGEKTRMKNRYQLKSYLLRDSDVFYIMDDIILEDKRVLPHCHDFYEFFFVLEGELLENCNGKNTLLGEKQFHLLEPDDEHLIRQSPNCSKSVLRNIAIDWSFLKRDSQILDVAWNSWRNI